MNKKIQLAGLSIDALCMSDVLDLCERHIQNKTALLVGVLNVAKLMKSLKDAQLRQSLYEADILLADGQGIVMLCRWRGTPLPERVAGIDLLMHLLERADRARYRVFFLGARQEVLEKVVTWTQQHHPNVQVAGYRNGYFKKDEEETIAHQIRDSHADILFVGVPTPKKENFLSAWRSTMQIPVCHGVGGSFDVIAGITQRAPKWMQKAGLEWFYRVVQEPRRMWKRYLVTNCQFFLFCIKEICRTRIFKRKNEVS